MNDPRQLIREYEQSVTSTPSTLEDKLQLEKRWKTLYATMERTHKQGAKKRKSELLPFMKKIKERRHLLAESLYKTIWDRPSPSFGECVKAWPGDCEEQGVRGAIAYAIHHQKLSATFDGLVSRAKEREVMGGVAAVDLFQEMEERSQVCGTLADALETERSLCRSYLAFRRKSEEDPSLKKRYASELGTLCQCIERVQDVILFFLGYEGTVQDLFPKKAYLPSLRTEGVVSAIQEMEENGDGKMLSKTILDLMEQIVIRHPKEEFPEASKMKRTFIIHEGGTNSGKTYHAVQALKEAESGVYLAPIRLLALEIQEKLSKCGVPCDLVTGEVRDFVPNAKHRSCTIEMAPFSRAMKVAVIDEMQMIADEQRGYAWVRALFGIRAEEIHICGAPHATPFITKLIEEAGCDYEIRRYERKTPLLLEEQEFLYPHSIESGDALIVFSKNRVLAVANELKSLGYKVSMVYGKLPADTRRRQVELFSSGKTDVLVSTDAIGIGLNLPIRRTVFLEFEKYDGDKSRKLTTQEVKQIAGRAGRKGKYEVGYVNAVEGKEHIRKELSRTEKKIEKSVILPPAELADLKTGTLRQRLRAWQEAALPVGFLEKADISAQMTLLKQLEGWEMEIPAEDVFKSLYIPFDSNDRELLGLWTDYMRQLKEGNTTLTKPVPSGHSLKRLETYYQQINLYGNFSRKFRLAWDGRWMKEEKKKTVYGINSSLRSSKSKIG